jgi:hypothetical protein
MPRPRRSLAEPCRPLETVEVAANALPSPTNMGFTRTGAVDYDTRVTSVDATAIPWLVVGPTRVTAWDPAQDAIAWRRSFRLGEMTTLEAVGTAEVAVIVHDHSSDAPARWYGLERATGDERWACERDWSSYDLALDGNIVIAAGYPHDGEHAVLAAVDARTGKARTRRVAGDTVRGFARTAGQLWAWRAEELLRVAAKPLAATAAGACGSGVVACGDLLCSWRQDEDGDRVVTRDARGKTISEVALRKVDGDDWLLSLAATGRPGEVLAWRARSGVIHLIDVRRGRAKWCARPPWPKEVDVTPTPAGLVCKTLGRVQLRRWRDGATIRAPSWGPIGDAHAIGDRLVITRKGRLEVWLAS